jgi:putative membrane protein
VRIARPARRRLYAGAALAASIIAISPFLDALSDASFAWHMIQHLLLLFAVPLFALLAHPLEWFGSPRARWRIAAIRVARSAPIRALTSPAGTLPIFVAVLWSSHFTTLYELALEHPLVHVAEHVLYVAAGTLFWIPVVAPPPFAVPPHPVRALYCFLALPQGALLAAALLAARTPLYSHYGGAGALSDQHNAAAVMWIAGGGIVFFAFLATIASWAARERCPDNAGDYSVST